MPSLLGRTLLEVCPIASCSRRHVGVVRLAQRAVRTTHDLLRKHGPVKARTAYILAAKLTTVT